MKVQVYVYEVFDANGEPKVANTPTRDEMQTIANLRTIEDRYEYAQALANDGIILDVPVHVWGWDYWKAMAQRRVYGYTWIPSGLLANVIVAPGLGVPGLPSYDEAARPEGAILVPPTEIVDRNYKEPELVNPDPIAPEEVVVFGPPVNSQDYPGAYLVGATNTAPVGRIAYYLGNKYILVRIRRVFNDLKLWLPV